MACQLRLLAQLPLSDAHSFCSLSIESIQILLSCLIRSSLKRLALAVARVEDEFFVLDLFKKTERFFSLAYCIGNRHSAIVSLSTRVFLVSPCVFKESCYAYSADP